MSRPSIPSPRVSPLEASIERLCVRTRLAIFVGTFLRWAGVASALCGGIVLLLRAGLQLPVWTWPAYAVPLGVALFAAALVTHQRGLSRQGAAAWIDVHSGGSGLVLTGSERPDPRWDAAFEGALAKSHRMPTLAVRPQAGQALFGIGFLSLALFVQIPEPGPLGPSPAFVAALTEDLAQKLQTLSENISLDEELAEEFSERMRRIQEMAEEAPSESVFEAIDRLEERLGLEGERAAQELEQSLGELWRSMQGGELDQERLERLLDEARGLLANSGLGEKLPESLVGLLGSSLELPQGVHLNPAELMQLAEGLSGLMQGSLGEMLGAGLLDASKLSLASKFAKLENFLPNAHQCDEECRAGG